MHFPHQLSPNHGEITGPKSPYFYAYWATLRRRGLDLHGEGNLIFFSILTRRFEPLTLGFQYATPVK